MIIIFIINETDENLQKIKERNPEIFEELYSSYKDKILTYLVIKTKGNRFLSEELLSETFYSALVSAPKVNNLKNILGWLIQIANCRFNDYLRRQYLEEKHSNMSNNEEYFIEDNADLLHRKEKTLIMYEALDKLKSEYKEIIKMKYLDNKTINDISLELKKDFNAVKSLLFRAKEALRKELKKSSKLFL